MNFKVYTIFVVLIVCFSCGNKQSEFSDEANGSYADSLSIALNSPELKAINAELLTNPSSPELYNKRSKIYLKLKQFEEAVNDSKRAIKIDSTVPTYYNTLVDVYFTKNDTRLAKELLEIVVVKFPTNTEALLKLAELYFLVRQYQNGITYVNKALKVDENLAKGYYIKGSIYRESGDTAKAISSLETAIEQDNKFEDAYFDLGILFAARKNPIALEYYNNALALNPKNSNTKYARAKLLQDIGKIDESIIEYKSIIATNPDCENCYYNLGAIYLEVKKDNKLALQNFTKAIEINPNYLEAYFARGYTYTKLKDKISAKADYDMCLKIQPNYDEAVEALNNM